MQTSRVGGQAAENRRKERQKRVEQRWLCGGENAIETARGTEEEEERGEDIGKKEWITG